MKLDLNGLLDKPVHVSETSVDNHFTRQYNPEDNSEQAENTYQVLVMASSYSLFFIFSYYGFNLNEVR
jgi:hypothetical protein